MKKRLAIVGNGMAAGRLLDDLFRRNAGARFDVTVFGEEAHGCYNRILLGRIIGGSSTDDILTKPRAWYADRGVAFHSDTRVTRLDTAARKLATAAGAEFAFDACVLATGSAPFVPPLDNLKGADDCTCCGVVAVPAKTGKLEAGAMAAIEMVGDPPNGPVP